MTLNLRKYPEFNLLILAILCLILAYCLTSCKTCEPITTTIHDSVYVEKTPFDTLIWISSHKGKEQEFTNCDSLYALLSRHSGTLTTKENGVKSTITNSGKRLVFTCETDSLKEVIRLLREKTTHIKETVKIVPVKCKLKHEGWMDGLYKRCFWILVLVGIVLIGWKFRRFIPFLKGL